MYYIHHSFVSNVDVTVSVFTTPKVETMKILILHEHSIIKQAVAFGIGGIQYFFLVNPYNTFQDNLAPAATILTVFQSGSL